ncbi:MAG: hypothetical protein FWC72_00005, partial [Oscillospiraceae bacterium]|nr:hypothetical protein [Oscillospiraceae bacterium]
MVVWWYAGWIPAFIYRSPLSEENRLNCRNRASDSLTQNKLFVNPEPPWIRFQFLPRRVMC